MKNARVPIALIVLASSFLALPLQARQAAATGSKEALSVVDKLVNALGGRKALEAVKDMTLSGSAEIVQFGLTVPVTIYQKEPDKLRIDITITEAGMTIIRAFDGQNGWMTNPQNGTTEAMPDFMTKEMSRQAAQNQALLDPRKAKVSYALKPKAVIEGKEYIVLEQTLADGHKTTFFLDPATSLPYKTQARTLDQNGAEVDSESYTTNYQKVGGLMVPYAVRVVQNGADAQRMTITAVSFNTNIDDAFFALKR